MISYILCCSICIFCSRHTSQRTITCSAEQKLSTCLNFQNMIVLWNNKERRVDLYTPLPLALVYTSLHQQQMWSCEGICRGDDRTKRVKKLVKLMRVVFQNG